MNKRVLCVLICVLLLLTACAPAATPVPTPEAPAATPATPVPTPEDSTPASAIYTPGTYTAVAKGNGGEMNVSVVFDETNIVSVEVLENKETLHIFRAANPRVPEAIVAGQTLNVDLVAGATISSAAIINAVADCVTQAGGDADALRKKEKDPVAKNADQTIETDVLVVGSGMAGTAAAIEAATAGAKVLLIEKLATLGGSSAISGGKLQATESFIMQKNGVKDTKADFAKYLMERARDMASPEMVEMVANNSADNVQWLADLGVKFMPETTTLHPYRPVPRGHLPEEQKGFGYLNPMEAKARELGVTYMTETPAKSLIVKDGAVVGVMAEDATGAAITINAKAVILATGSFDRNQDLMNEFSPLIKKHMSSGVVSNTGDGLLMARDIGAATIKRPGAIGNCLDVTFTYMSSTAGGSFQAASTGLFVAGKGERFVDENNFSFARTAAMLDKEYTEFYSVFDQTAYVDGLERAIEMKRAFKADTLADLAAQTGMDAATLEATVKRYNELCKAGKDTDYNKPAEFLTPVAEGPFYALLHTYVVSGTFGGLKIDKDAHVLNESGAAIPGLYAAGEVANGDVLCYEYPGSGSALITYLTFGRVAGEKAAAELK